MKSNLKKHIKRLQHQLNDVEKKARLCRVIAKAIDYAIAGVLLSIPGAIGVLISATFLLIIDCFSEGKSPGKKVMGFKVISIKDGTPCSIKQSLVRNTPLVFPLLFTLIANWAWAICLLFFIPMAIMELYFVMKLDSFNRFGDILADTTVVANDPRCEDFKNENELWNENDLSVPLH